VASLLGIPVILVLDGGIGSTIDSFCLCRALFKTHGVPILGVVINRVKPEKHDSIASVLGVWFAGAGVPVFGILPFEERIARPSITSIIRELEFAGLTELKPVKLVLHLLEALTHLFEPGREWRGVPTGQAPFTPP